MLAGLMSTMSGRGSVKEPAELDHQRGNCYELRKVFQLGLCRFVSGKDTEAAVGDLQVPQVHPEVVSRDERLEVGVDRDGVDVVGVRIAENASGRCLNHQVHGLQHWHLFRKIQFGGEKK